MADKEKKEDKEENITPLKREYSEKSDDHIHEVVDTHKPPSQDTGDNDKDGKD